jgi:hypothetical protein
MGSSNRSQNSNVLTIGPGPDPLMSEVEVQL